MYIEYTIRRNKPGAVGSIPSAARARSSVPAADRSERLISLPELASYHGLGTRSGLWGRDGRTALPGAWRSDLRVSGEPSSLHTRRCHRGSSRDDGAICGVRKRLNRESPRRHGVTSCNRVSALIPRGYTPTESEPSFCTPIRQSCVQYRLLQPLRFGGPIRGVGRTSAVRRLLRRFVRRAERLWRTGVQNRGLCVSERAAITSGA